MLQGRSSIIAALLAVLISQAGLAADPAELFNAPDVPTTTVSPDNGVSPEPFLQHTDAEQVINQMKRPPAPAPNPNAPQAWSFDEYKPYVQRYGIGYDAGDGIGYKGGFGTFEMWTPLNGDYEWDMLFGDARLNVLNDATIGANLGLGYRKYNLEWNRIFGINAYWDWRDTGTTGFSQIGVGLESLGPLVDFRANAYIPDIDSLDGTTSSEFVGHRLILNKQLAMTGFDAEMGVSVLNEDRWQLKLFGGGYYFDGHKGENAGGWRFRAETNLDQQYFVDARVQHDKVFGTTASVGVAIRFLHRFLPPFRQTPAPMDHKFFRRRGDAEAGNIASRLSDPVERLQNIVLQDLTAVATDAAGNPLNFLHVVNGGAGTGTFENPYGALNGAIAAAAPGDIVYTPEGGTFNENLVLTPGIQVLGNGIAQYVDTQFGAELLPFSPNANGAPTLTGTVTMADDTKFSGFAVTGQILANNVQNIQLAGLGVTSAGADAITLTNVDGATISDVSVTATGAGNSGIVINNSDASLTNFLVAAAADNGVEINQTAGTNEVSITNLTVQTAGTHGVDVNGTGGTLDLIFNRSGTTGGNTISSVGNAVDVVTTAGTVNLQLDHTTARSTTARGINLDGSGGGVLHVDSLNNVTVSKASTGGFVADTVDFDVSGGNMTVGSSTTLANVAGGGVNLTNTTGSLNFSVVDIFSTGPGLFVNAGGPNTFSISSGSTSTISSTAGSALNLTGVDIGLAFDSVRSAGVHVNGIRMNNVTGSLGTPQTNINGASSAAVFIANTPAALSVSLGAVSIQNAFSPNVSDNFDITTGNFGNLTLTTTSVSVSQ
jgi:hypothetical protein